MYDSPTVITHAQERSQDPKIGPSYFLTGANSISALSPKYICLEFRGTGVIANQLVNTKEMAQSIIEQKAELNQFFELLAGSSGSFTCVVYDSTDQSIYFLNDPLGGGMIFLYENAGMQALSVDILNMRSAVQGLGGQITRNILYEFAGFVTGSHCHGGDTPYHEIDLVEPGVGMKVSREGCLSKIDYGVNNYMYSGGAGKSYEELIDSGADAVEKTIAAAVDANAELLLADLSGGFDSRLVLAGIASVGATSEVVIRSIKNSPEWEYALGLANVYGMRITDFRGFDPAGTGPRTFFESSVAGARSSGGIITNDVAQNAIPARRIKLQGGYGETFRTFNNWYYEDGDFSPSILGEHIWSWSNLYKIHIDGRPLFNIDYVLEALSSKMDRFTSRARKYNIQNHEMSSFWYQQGRNRYWIGQQSYHTSRVLAQIDPLYSIDLIAAAYSLGFWDRKSNLVGLDAMLRLDRRLLELPYLKKGVVTERFLSRNPDISSRGFPSSGATLYSPASRSHALKFSETNAEPVSEHDRAEASRLGISTMTATGIRQWAHRAFEAINGSVSVSSMFNPDALSNLLLGPIKSKEQAQTIANLIGVLFRCGALQPDDIGQVDRFIFN